MSSFEKVWFTAKEAAEYTGRHHDTILRACENGQLAGLQRVRKGKWMIHRDNLDAFMAGQPMRRLAVAS